MSGKGSAKAYRKALSSEKSFQVFYRTAQETAAGKDSVGKIKALFFLRFLRHLYTPGYGLCKVVNKKSGKNFLQNQHGDFGVKMDQTHRVFQTAEGGFNAPSLSIKCFQSIGREFLRIQVCDQGFCIPAADFHADNPKAKCVKFCTPNRQKIECSLAGNMAVIFRNGCACLL